MTYVAQVVDRHDALFASSGCGGRRGAGENVVEAVKDINPVQEVLLREVRFGHGTVLLIYLELGPFAELAQEAEQRLVGAAEELRDELLRRLALRAMSSERRGVVSICALNILK